MTHVAAHELTFPNPEDELDFLENELLAEALEFLEADPDNVATTYLDCLRIIGFKTVLGKEPAEFFTPLNSARDYGVGLFMRGNIGPDDSVTLSLSGEEITLVGGTSVFNTAMNWLSAYGIARILRDEKAVAHLCNYNSRNFEGEYDKYHISLVNAIVIYESGDINEAENLLEIALDNAQNATMFPSRGKKYGVPVVELASAVLLKNDENIRPCVVKALQAHCWAYGNNKDSHLAESYIPFIIVGLCALAYDRGVSFGIDSLYFPKFMVEGG